MSNTQKKEISASSEVSLDDPIGIEVYCKLQAIELPIERRKCIALIKFLSIIDNIDITYSALKDDPRLTKIVLKHLAEINNPVINNILKIIE